MHVNSQEFQRRNLNNPAAILLHQKGISYHKGIPFWELLEIIWKKLILTAPEFYQMVKLTIVNVDHFVAFGNAFTQTSPL